MSHVTMSGTVNGITITVSVNGPNAVAIAEVALSTAEYQAATTTEGPR